MTDNEHVCQGCEAVLLDEARFCPSCGMVSSAADETRRPIGTSDVHADERLSDFEPYRPDARKAMSWRQALSVLGVLAGVVVLISIVSHRPHADDSADVSAASLGPAPTVEALANRIGCEIVQGLAEDSRQTFLRLGGDFRGCLVKRVDDVVAVTIAVLPPAVTSADLADLAQASTDYQIIGDGWLCATPNLDVAREIQLKIGGDLR